MNTSLSFGIQHALDRLVATHLFVLCPNNSGSTFVKNALQASAATWNLGREGQHTFGFAGPQMRGSNRPLIWAARPEWVAGYIEPANFDWPATQRAWYSQAFARNAQASVFVEKSPPFLLITHLLEQAFVDARFLIMVRDPYAAYEGIVRRKRGQRVEGAAPVQQLAAEHLMACFDQQRRNIERLGDRAVFFTYEELCADPQRCAALVAALVPALHDLDLDQQVPVKGIYDERLRNMNDDQLAALGDADREVATAVFAAHRGLLRDFGYDLR